METQATTTAPIAPLAGSRVGLGRKKARLVADIIAWTALALGGVTMAIPFLWMISGSLKPLPEIYAFPPTFIPEKIQWLNYVEIFRRLPFHLFFRNSAYIASLTTIGVLFTSSLAGYAFARLRFPGRDAIFLVYMSTMMIPFAVRMIPLFILLKTFGWIDTHIGLIVPGLVSSWGTFLNRQFMLTLPRELEDAALIDGCTFFAIYRKIILPLSKPVLATLGIFTFMGSWNGFMWPLIVLHSMEKRTIALGLAAFQSMQALKTPWHLIMTASVVSVVPILVLFVAGQKYYVQGIVTTGLKGTA